MRRTAVTDGDGRAYLMGCSGAVSRKSVRQQR
jgi:hypothetical protein